MLADMAIGVEASRLAVMKSAWMADNGERNTYYASIAKCLAGDVCNKVKRKLLCTTGKLRGRIVSTVGACNKRIDIKKRYIFKRAKQRFTSKNKTL